VDTRSKIMTAAEAPREGVLILGHFDVLGVEHVRALRQIREAGGLVVAVVLPGVDGVPPATMSQQARAEMAAALRVVDYVLLAAPPGQPGSLEDLVKSLKPKEIVPLDEIESRRLGRLIERLPHG
jgi:glycerol-3-phosphate cytidylyltransferase-like family protein